MQSIKNWPTSEFDNVVPEECLVEANSQKKTIACNIAIQTISGCPELVRKYENWRRLLRITVWLLRWYRSRGASKAETLSVDELKHAEKVWLKMIQQQRFYDEYNKLSQGETVPSNSPLLKLDPFIDQQCQLIRVGGRLQFASIPFEAKHQIIIPHQDVLIEKLVLYTHSKASHAGTETTLTILRQRFWLTKGQREVKRVLTKCLIRKHWKTKPCQQKMAPLPPDRVQITPAFTNVGLDFTGPLYLKSKPQSNADKRSYVFIYLQIVYLFTNLLTR